MAQPFPKKPIVFPVKGLHEGSGYDFQPTGTTPSAQNVRGFDAIKNRLRGGRRAGLDKYVEELINGGDAIQEMTRAVQSQGTSSSTPVPTGNTIADLAASGAGANLGPSMVGFLSVATQSIRAGYRYTVTAGTSITLDYTQSGGTLNLDRGSSGIASAGNTDNSIRVTQSATGRCSTSSNGVGLVNECHGLFVGVRMTENLQSGVFGYLERVGASSCRLRLITGDIAVGSANGAIPGVSSGAELAVSGTLTLNNSAVATADCEIEVTEEGDTITATLTWPTQLLSESISASTAFNTGMQRVCVWGAKGTTTIGVADVAARWDLRSIEFNLIEPQVYFVEDQFEGTDLPQSGAPTFFVKENWTSAAITTAGVLTSAVGFATSAANTTYAQINRASQIVQANTAANTTRYVASTEAPAIENRWIAASCLMTAAITRVMGASFRVSDDFRSAIVIEPTQEGRSGSTTAKHDEISEWLVVACLNGVRTVLYTWSTAQVSANHKMIVNTEELVFENDYPTLRMTWRGITLAEYTLTAGNQATVAALIGNTRAGGCVTLGTGTNGLDGFRLLIGSVPGDTPDEDVSSVSDALIVVAGGTIKRVVNRTLQSISGGTDALSDVFGTIALQAAYNQVFFVDGVHNLVYNLNTNEVETWVADDGDLPDGARLIALYRGRIVLAGLQTDPHNWFMSKVGDPFDFDYSPAVTTETQAVAGNNADVGLIGDIITALIPFGDDAMLFGGDHSIYQMTGDPASGGTIDLITDKTGIAFGKAWTKDPSNNLFFWGQDGIYRFTLGGGEPVNITKGRLDVRLRAVDRTTSRIRMEWDYERAGLVVTIIPVDTSVACTCFFWDSRTDAWWPDSYPTAFGPTIVYAYDGVAADDQAFLMGCRDGYIRMIDEDADDDDGTEIESFFRYEPFIAADHDAEVIINSIMPILAGDSGSVYLNIYTGQSAEECVTRDTPRVRRLIAHAGRNASVRQKVRGYAIQLGVSHTGSVRWALEGLTVGFDQSGMPKREVRNGS